MDKKVSVYICSGCDIGKNLDIEALKNIAEKEYKVPVKVYDTLCSDSKHIRDEIDIGINTVIIAACSMREKQDVFNFGKNVITERVNLREGVVWSHEKNENTQMMAEDYLRMGIASALKKDLPVPDIENISRDILVVGGGVTGITAALEIAKANYRVYLIEKDTKLGGKVRGYKEILPGKFPYKDPVNAERYIYEKVDKLEKDQRIKVFTSSEIDSISGQPGMFDVTFKNNGAVENIRVGAIVLATGWEPYDARKIDKYQYGKQQDIITNLELEKMLKDNKIKTAGGKDPKNFAFILCAGQREKENIPYCSTVCCLSSLKEALEIRKSIKDSKVYIFYKDIRTLGIYEEFYKKVQEDEGIYLTKGTVEEIRRENSSSEFSIYVKDTLLGKDIRVKADIITLATGMLSSLYGLYTVKEEYPDAGAPIYSHIQSVPVESIEALKSSGKHILNLQYRQGPELPTLRDGFPDSHYICFPYETRRTGIYAAGTVRSPMTVLNCELDAKGAALKAIQAVEEIARGEITGQTRVGDLDHLTISLQRCTQCRRCTEECPFGALNEDDKTYPLYNPLRCRACGACLGACPAQAISFKQYSVDVVSSTIKSIVVPEEEDKPRILVFACENDAYPALDMAAKNRISYSEFVRIIPVRCLGSVNTIFIADALSKGIDGILLMGCKFGEDYQCHFIRGSELASKRIENMQETFQRLALEPERLKLEQVEISDWNKVDKIINNFVEYIKSIGPNPYKGL